MWTNFQKIIPSGKFLRKLSLYESFYLTLNALLHYLTVLFIIKFYKVVS